MGASLILGVLFVRCIFVLGEVESMARAQPGGVGVKELLSEMSLLVGGGREGVQLSSLNPVLLQTRK